MERALEVLEAAVGAYNSQADRLALIPASAKRAEGVVYEVRVNRAAGSAGDLISVDLKVGMCSMCGCAVGCAVACVCCSHSCTSGEPKDVGGHSALAIQIHA